jgi:BirA family biotin operon repressor/biotin-[acetyl-CoA-carboxylase] ligase
MGVPPANRARTWRLRRFATIDSTNRWLLDQARAGEPEGLVAVADEQTAGRGRRGRTWSAAPGSSLLVSVLVRPSLDAERVHLVTMAAAVALADAIARVAGVTAALKWPNDLVVDDRKLAGILAEAEISSGGDVSAVVVGVGCNVSWDVVPSDLVGLATACNLEAGRPVDRAELLDVYLEQLGSRLDDLASVEHDYPERLATLGRRVRVDLGDRVLVGTATGVDAAGRLLVDPDDSQAGEGGVVAVAAGDVVHLRPA